MKNNSFGHYFIDYVNFSPRTMLRGGIILTLLIPSLALPNPCPSAPDYQNCLPINTAVAWYQMENAPLVINNFGNTCTGTLLNTTNGKVNSENHHYFLTARHCLDELQSQAIGGVTLRQAISQSPNNPLIKFHWFDITNQRCGIPREETIKIIQVVGEDTPNDFALLELDSSPFLESLYHAGWDVRTFSDNIMGTFTSFYHPHFNNGVYQQLKLDSNSLSTVGGAHGGSMWALTLNNYSASGASGSCLFAVTSINNRSAPPTSEHCIGQLEGPGVPSCPSNNQVLKYGKLSTVWSLQNLSQVKNALDPPPPGQSRGVICQDASCISGVDGDPHIITRNNIKYDFQGAGEYIVLRNRNGLEIQTRQTPIATNFTPVPDPYDGLATCVSLNTAFAARVGKHRVTYQPNLSGIPDPTSLQLRIDGKLTRLGSAGLTFDDGAHIEKIIPSGILKIDYPDQTVVTVTPGWWDFQQTWYLHVEAVRPPSLDGEGGTVDDPGSSRVAFRAAKQRYSKNPLPLQSGASDQGLMAAIPNESWLPELPDGSTVGPIPPTPEERFEQLYHQFGDAWRVNAYTSLFDYAKGTSTKTFTNRNWPRLNGNCSLPYKTAILKPIPLADAQKACERVQIQDKAATFRNCVFDVMTTGNPGFAKTYLETLSVRPGATKTALLPTKNKIYRNDVVYATVTVSKTAVSHAINPTGAVQLFFDGKESGNPVKLDTKSQAKIRLPTDKTGLHLLSATYIPSSDTGFLSSRSSIQSFQVLKSDKDDWWRFLCWWD